MGKKSKQKKAPEKKKQSPVIWIVAAVIAVAAVLAATGNLPFVGNEKEAGKSFNLTGKETRPLLDPSMFTGMTRAAYAAAAQYPDMMNEVFCYCFCNEPPFKHKTLLSCFADKHGAGWLLCQKEALRVAQLTKEGKSVNEIKKTIDREFGM